ncbi:MAG: divalent-cation tolerance protein CutA [Candidatus Nanohaloarchaea archaeon]|nr:divalent-cation tolerance protein CutA [Candidatus Nanohaloarchaea archaeon]
MQLYYVTFPDRDVMDEITQQLLDERLIACVNTFPVGSVYWWDDEQERDGEVGAFLKTSDRNSEAVVERLEEEHPYDVPEILEIEVSANEAYRSWVDEETE